MDPGGGRVANPPENGPLLDNIKNSPGYFQGLRLDGDELSMVRELVSGHMAEQLGRIAPDKVGLFRSTPLEQYHRISSQLPHERLLTRQQRILPAAAVDRIKSTSLYQALQEHFSVADITDEEGVGRPSVSLRLVRPGFESDVGSLHADDWFWQIYGFTVPPGMKRVKVWVAVCCETGKSGLLLSPDSHKRAWRYHLIDRAGMKKPLLDEDERPVLELFQSRPGDAVVFNYDLLHGGAVTRGAETRVSIEFTTLVPEARYAGSAPLN